MKGADNPVGRVLGPHLHLSTEFIQTWSLAIEVHFYIIWSLALWATARARWSRRSQFLLAVGGVAAVFLWRTARFDGNNWLPVYLSTSTRMDAPLMGAVAAIAFAAGWTMRVPARVWAALGATALGTFIVAAFTVDWTSSVLPQWLYTALAFCGAIAIIGAVCGRAGWYTRALSAAPLVFLGRISYSLYLWHYPLFWTIQRKDPSWPGPIRFIVGVGAALVISTASYYLIEQPFLRRKNRVRVRSPRDARA
jgi:peptidoglycan/LPS O-acetylase OafA/YrhL